MYEVIEDEDEKKKCQNILEKIVQLQVNAENKYKIGADKKNNEKRIEFDKNIEGKCYIYWSSELKFWSVSFKYTKSGNRYVNWFGFTNPKLNNKILKIDVEISISVNSNRAAGKFVRYKNENKSFITHNGHFKKNNKSIKDKFIEYYEKNHKDKIIETNDGEKLVKICELSSDETNYSDLKNEFNDSIREVYKIKTEIEKNGIDGGCKQKGTDGTTEEPPIKKDKRIKISKKTAQEYYNKLSDNYNMKTDLANKVSMLKKLMEREILKEVAGINHYDDLYNDNNVIIKSGQRKWLMDNRERRNKNGGILNGFVPKVIVSGIQPIFDWRNIAEHNDEEILYSTYLGLFTTVAKTIAFFSNTDIPKKIMDICNGNKQKTT
jgi:hypothetical protein